MSTWGELLADIRLDLRDTDEANPRWSDSTLLLYAKDAIRAYSLAFPMRKARTSLAAADGAFELPANFMSVISVEMEQGHYLEPELARPGLKVRAPQRATAYYASGGSLHLDFPPGDGDTVLLSYNACHDLPASEEDALTIPLADEELIRIYVKAKVAEQMRLAQSALDRFKPGSGSRDDNPLLPESAELYSLFEAKVAERKGGIIILYRPGAMP